MKKIVILHGWTYSLDRWQAFTRELRELGLDVELLKIPGLTEKSELVWDLDKYSEWLKGKIRTTKGDLVLLGHSNGGRIASYFTFRYPDLVQKLVLIDSAGVVHNEFSARFKRFVFSLLAKGGKRFTNSAFLRKLLYKLTSESDYYNAAPNMRRTMQNMIEKDMTPVFTSLKLPTLIIWGEGDKITPLSDGFSINKLIVNSKLKVIKGARHAPFYTHPKEVAKIIKDGI